MMQPAPATSHHRWLQQLVGTWRMTFDAPMESGESGESGEPAEPGGETFQSEATETVRSIGDLWILAEGRATFDGASFTSLLTLGYDPARESFVGTWADSMQTHLWTYVGHLDDDRRALLLDTEGPALGDPTKSARYRERIELVAPDYKVMTSSMLGEDGAWTTIMRADYHRLA